MGIRGKKLLILGANPETVPLIQLAQEMGVYTIVTDYDPNAYAKPFADKSYNVDGMDVIGLVELAKKESVDGVMVGTADPLIVPYQKVCELLNLPSFATEEQVKIFTNKYYFKRKCEEFGVSGIPEFKLDNTFRPEDMGKIQYPVLIKPADSNSGKGMTICYNENEIPAAVKKALEFSATNRFLVEKFMDCDDMFVYYTFKDGIYSLSAIADKHNCKEQGVLSPICLGCTYPSKYTDLYFKTMHQNMLNIFKSLTVKNGVLMVTAFVENGKMYVYDPGFRLQGEAPNILINQINGFDQRKMLINLALTGSMGDEDLSIIDNYNFKGKFAATIWFLLKKGKIGHISGLDELKSISEIVSIVQRFKEGDVVDESFIGTEKQVLMRLYVVCENKNKFNEFNHKIKSLIKVVDVEGNNMLLSGYDLDDV